MLRKWTQSGSFLDEISKYMPSEVICNEAFLVSGLDLEELRHRLGMAIYPLDAWYFDDQMACQTLTDHFMWPAPTAWDWRIMTAA